MARGLPSGGPGQHQVGRKFSNLTPAQGRNGFSTRVTGVEGLRRHIDTFGKRAPYIHRNAVTSVAKIVKEAINTDYQRALGPGRRMSHIGQKGVRVGVWYDVKGQLRPVAILRPVPPGPAAIIEFGAYKKPSGYMIAKKGPGRRRRGSSTSRFASGSFYQSTFGGVLASRERNFFAVSPVHHPGPKPKPTWVPASRRVIAVGNTIMRHQLLREYRRIWTG